MTRGFVVGKFYPPHAGHHHIIDVASRSCDELIVLLAASRVESIPAEQRHHWLVERHPDAIVRWTIDDHPIDYDDPAVWDAHVAVFRSAVPEAIDVVFTGEPYGDELARRMAARHEYVPRDPGGPSGRAIRADPAAHWQQLEPPVRAYLAKRVVVVGAESTGTTTLARALAEHYGTVCVPEYGWEYSERKLAEGTFGEWDEDDFALIAAHQLADEDRGARDGAPLLICDTDVLATCVWAERYLGRTERVAELLAAQRTPSLYLLTSHEGVPFEHGPLRDGEHVREWMTGRFRDRLARQPAPWLEVTGTYEERVRDAVASIDGVLAQGWSLSPPLG